MGATRAAPSIWDDVSMVERLRLLWAEGRPASKIAAELGISKNAVIGKANRLGLAPRLSPLPATSSTRGRVALKPRPPQPPRKLVVQRAIRAVVRAQVAAGLPHRLEMFGPPAPPRPAPLPPALFQPAPARPSRHCCWVVGDGRPAVFCDAPAAAGRPYCEAHAARAFVPRRGVLPGAMAARPRDVRGDGWERFGA